MLGVSEVILGVDLGGSSFDVGLVSYRGELIDRTRMHVDHTLGAERLWARLADLLDTQSERARRREVKVVAVGVGCAGPLGDNLSSVSPVNIPAWYQFDLGHRIATHLGVPVFGDLDARALALSEGWLGAAKKRPNFCAINVGDAVAGGIVVDGQLLEGATGNAGQVGHIIVVPGGRRCSCGAQGCLDAEASGLAVASMTGRPLSEPTYEIMQRTGRLVGQAAAGICASLNLDLVVIGGNVAFGFAATFFTAAQEELERLSAAASISPRIVAARLADRGPLVGAAAIAIRGLNHAERRIQLHTI
jgi:glucokinase